MTQAEVRRKRNDKSLSIGALRLTEWLCFQVDVLERDVSELLSLVRRMKNTFAPINRIPREILSTLPDYLSEEYTADQDLITLTHVCNGWRELFISCPFLWTYLDCKNVEKTRAYIERSKSSLLEVYFRAEEYSPLPYDAFLLTVPHIGRLKSLYLSGSSVNLVEITNAYFYCPAPFLERLHVHYSLSNRHAIETPFFDGNLPSLQALHLDGVVTSLPWENLANLTTFDFRNVPSDDISVTQLLDFFECAPLLSDITLFHASPTASDASLGRVVPLPSLKCLAIITQPVHSTLLNYLSIPSGTSLVLRSGFSNEAFPIPDHLLKTFENLNLSHITSIDIECSRGVGLQLNGPSGRLRVRSDWLGAVTSLPIIQHQALRSLSHFHTSATEKLTITEYKNSLSPEIQKSPPYQTLLAMDALRTLVLVKCHNIPFVSALDPSKIPSGALVCPKLGELVLHIKKEKWFCINELLEMAKERDSKGARLSTITIISWHEFVPTEEVLELRNHVSHVKYRLRPASILDGFFDSDSE